MQGGLLAFVNHPENSHLAGDGHRSEPGFAFHGTL
jgi:hypothetical protein